MYVELLAEGIAFAELFTDGLDDVVGVAVGLGEDESLGHFLPAREDFRQLVAESADDGANLVRIDDGTVQLGSGVGFVFILLFPAFLAGELFAALYLLLRLDLAAGLGDLGFDHIDLVADVDAIGHCFFVAVVADDVLLEEAVGAVIRGGGEADEASVEVIEHLLPQVVDGAVAFVDKDEVEEFRRHLLGIDDRQWRLGLGQFSRVDLFGGFVELGALENGVEALDGADADLAILGDVGGFQALDVVELGEFAVIVERDVGHHFLLGLFAEVLCVDQEEHALGVGVLE